MTCAGGVCMTELLFRPLQPSPPGRWHSRLPGSRSTPPVYLPPAKPWTILRLGMVPACKLSTTLTAGTRVCILRNILQQGDNLNLRSTHFIKLLWDRLARCTMLSAYWVQPGPGVELTR